MQQKKKGTLTLHETIDGTGKHYAKWNKLGSERQIPYDLTYKWNLINKTNKQAKYNQRHGHKNKLTVTRGERGDDRAKKGKGQLKEHIQRTYGQEQRRGGLNVGEWVWAGQGRVIGDKVGQL